MTDWLLALVPSYGPPLVGLAIFVSCFAVPVPASLLLLAGGGFVAVGDIGLLPLVLWAWLGLALGDHGVYWLGRRGGAPLAERLGRRAASVRKARALLAARGGPFLFLSRWLFSPLGPYVNFAAGASRMRWWSFLIWGTAGEAVWLAIYTSLGHAFAGELEEASDVVVNALVMIGAAVIAICLGIWLFGARRRRDIRKGGQT
ncbi:DedA family protein [Pseudoroseicyclus sp. H15]